MRKSFVALVLLGTLALAIYGAVRYFQQDAARNHPAEVQTYTAPSRQAPAGMKEYRNEQYRFSIFVPTEVKVTERDEGQGAGSITFEDVPNSRGFEVFVVPYLDEQVSEERFRQDIPSGIRKDTQDVTIDGVVAASFHTVHEPLGETSEVWFIRDGYLYEVMTLRPLESWLAEVIATWEFL